MGRLWEWDFDLSMIFPRLFTNISMIISMILHLDGDDSMLGLKRSALALWILPGRGGDHPRCRES